MLLPPSSLHLSRRMILVGAVLAACTDVAPFRQQTLGSTAGEDPEPGGSAPPVVPAPAVDTAAMRATRAAESAGAGGVELELEPVLFSGAGGVASPGATGAAGAGGAGPMQPPPPEPDPIAGTSFDCASPSEPLIPALRLAPIASGLERPIYVSAAPGDDSRLFVIEKPGRIRVIRDGQVLEEPFLDISERVQEPVEEMGLLGLAFHPRYAENQLFYLSYSTDSQGGINPANTLVLAEFRARAGDPEHAEPEERRLLAIEKPQGNHNGGNLQFGADGYLYAGIGDGGGFNDAHGEIGNGQALDTLLGKLLRIDVNGRDAGPEAAYAIPAGNFAERAADALPEIWSIGLRNPWRFSFDACNGDLYIGDVGESAREEVDYVPGTQATGRNFGWRRMEAENCFNPGVGCDPAALGLTLPIASYGRMTGQSITGGYVYRGSALPELRGAYLYADYSSAVFFALRVQNGALVAEPEDITDNLNPDRSVDDITSFGQDNHGELYVTTLDGDVFRIEPG